MLMFKPDYEKKWQKDIVVFKCEQMFQEVGLKREGSGIYSSVTEDWYFFY